MVQCEFAMRYVRRCAIFALAALAPLAAARGCPTRSIPSPGTATFPARRKTTRSTRIRPTRKTSTPAARSPIPISPTVPAAPDDALSTIDRDKLQKSLVADRANAKYTDDHLEAGVPATAVVAAAAGRRRGDRPLRLRRARRRGARPRRAAARRAPAPRKTRPTRRRREKSRARRLRQTASLAPACRAIGPSAAVAAIAFAAGSTALSDAEKARLNDVAAMQHRDGGDAPRRRPCRAARRR